jgi:hypothetical protein
MALTSLRQNAVIRYAFPLTKGERLFEPDCLAPWAEFEIWLTAFCVQKETPLILLHSCPTRAMLAGELWRVPYGAPRGNSRHVQDQVKAY